MITTDLSRPQMPNHLVYSVIWVQHIICIFITHRVLTKDLIDKIAGCFWTPMDVPWKNKRLEIKLSSVLRCSVVSNSETEWTVAWHAPLSMGLSKQEYWSGLPWLLQGIFPTQGLNLHLLRLLHCKQILYGWVQTASPLCCMQPDSLSCLLEAVFSGLQRYCLLGSKSLTLLPSKTAVYL